MSSPDQRRPIYAVPACEACAEQMHPVVVDGDVRWQCPEGHKDARPFNLPVVPEDDHKVLSGAAAGLAGAVNRYVGRSRQAPFSERSLNLALRAYREALAGE